MSLIHVYGVGAGRSISGEQEDDSEKIRQRRLTIAQREEQIRRSAVLRERFSQAEAAEARRAIQLPKKSGQAAERGSLDNGSQLSTAARRPTAGTAVQRPRDTDEVSGRQPKPADPFKSPVSRQLVPLHDDAYQERLHLQHSEIHSGSEDLSDTDLTESAQASVQSTAEREPSVAQRLNHLLDDLPNLRGAQFADKFVSQLNEALSVFRNNQSHDLKEREADELLASLEFLDGYGEASRISDPDRGRVLQCIEAFRLELLGVGRASSAPSVGAFAAVSTAAVARQVAERGLTKGLPERSGGPRYRSSDLERKALDRESEMESELLGLEASASTRVQSNLMGSSKSNLSKDADKRREETLVTVTVRSV